jgi:leucyl-tRNA synthetase
MMELVNDLYAFSEQSASGAPGRRGAEGVVAANGLERSETTFVMGEALGALIRLLAPFAPHAAEEMWERLGHGAGIAEATWPAYDASVAKADEIVVPVQINGKVRSRLTVSADTSEQELERRALADPTIHGYTTGKTVRKVVVARGRIVSVVVQ